MTLTSETRAPEGARERPIIMSAPMVRAILAGRKTQTRRILRWQPDPVADYASGPARNAEGVWGQTIWEPGGVEQFCPLRLPAVVGEHVWVREAWCPNAEARDETLYRADGVHVVLDDGDGFTATNKDGSERSPWRSPIHMPRSRSRLTLEVTEVRVERLGSISEEDAKAEGVDPICDHGVGNQHLHTIAYQQLWDRLHGRGASALNPWVAAITFRLLPANESQNEGAAA